MIILSASEEDAIRKGHENLKDYWWTMKKDNKWSSF
jgi:hypothetical protein